MTEAESVRARLQTLAERRDRASAEHREASVELRAAIRQAVDLRLPVTEIAQLSGISRQAVYKLLRDDN